MEDGQSSFECVRKKGLVEVRHVDIFYWKKHHVLVSGK